MEYTAAVITVSDRCSKGITEDTSGPNLKNILEQNDWKVVYTSIVPDEIDDISKEFKHCSDDLDLCLVISTGGTGFSKRDVTPEATRLVIEKETPGIPEAMRLESIRITPHGCLSREAAGIRNNTLIINLPGSKKASQECLNAVIKAIKHGVDMLRADGSVDCGR